MQRLLSKLTDIFTQREYVYRVFMMEQETPSLARNGVENRSKKRRGEIKRDTRK